MAAQEHEDSSNGGTQGSESSSGGELESFTVGREDLLSLLLVQERIKRLKVELMLYGQQEDNLREQLRAKYSENGAYEIVSTDESTGEGTRRKK